MPTTKLKFGDEDRYKIDWTIVQGFFDTLPYPIFEISGGDSAEIVYCNDRFAGLLGYLPADLIGKNISDLAAIQSEVDRLHKDFSGPTGHPKLASPYVSQFKSRTGKSIPLSLDVMERVSDEGIDLGCLIIALPIDQSRNDSLTVRQVFYEIVERSGEAIGIAADDGTYLYRNPAHKELFGQADKPLSEVNLADLIVQVPGEERSIGPQVDTGVEDTEGWENSRETGGWVGLLNCITPDGPKPIWLRTHHIKDPVSKKPIRFAFLHDHSTEIARLNELAEAKLKAEEAQQTQHQLLHAVSHDFRAILQAASLYLDTADRKALKQGEEIKEIGRARDAIYSVQDHFQKIMDVLSNDASVFKPNIVYLNGQEVLSYVERTYMALADAKNIKLTTGGCDCAIATDASLMKRIVGNFVSNAIRFTAEGSVSVDCIQRGGRCGVRVTDTGVGIAPEKQGEIFEQFYQIHLEEDEGLGVGLSISQHLCELLGHTIELESTVGTGSTFTVWTSGT